MRHRGAWIRVRVLALAAWVAAGCSPSPDLETSSTTIELEETSETETDETEGIEAALAGLREQTQGEAKDAVVIGVRALPPTLDPFAPLEPWAQRIVDDVVFEGLMTRSESGAPWASEALADVCIRKPQPKSEQIYCHLRRDANFHDGSPVTVDDVLYSYGRFIGTRRVSEREREGLAGLRKVELAKPPTSDEEELQGVTDPENWLRISFDGRPNPLVLERLAAIKIVPRKRHLDRSYDFAKSPIGTGLMRVAHFGEERIVLERVAAPGRPGGPAPRLVIRAISDGARALTLLRRGEIHVVAEMSPAHIPDELGRPGMAARFRAFLVSPPEFDLVLYNLREGAQSRQPIRDALDAVLPRGKLAALHAGPSLAAPAPVDVHAPMPLDLEALTQDIESDAGLELWRAADHLDDDLQERLATAGASLERRGWKLERGVRRKPGGSLRLGLMWETSTGLARETAKTVRQGWSDVGVQVPNVTAGWNYLMLLMRGGKFDLALARYAEGPDLWPMFHSRGRLNLCGIKDAT
ncbi:MAG: ABC transporter substrate-binding protein, partial [Nannocystaceae bacterium]